MVLILNSPTLDNTPHNLHIFGMWEEHLEWTHKIPGKTCKLHTDTSGFSNQTFINHTKVAPSLLSEDLTSCCCASYKSYTGSAEKAWLSMTENLILNLFHLTQCKCSIIFHWRTENILFSKSMDKCQQISPSPGHCWTEAVAQSLTQQWDWIKQCKLLKNS